MELFERVKCKSCKENFGAESRGWLCSVCFKNKESDILTNKVIEETKEQMIIEDNRPKQENIYNCWKCDKKVGHLGFKCDCGYVFCRGHRHFSDHECDFEIKKVK